MPVHIALREGADLDGFSPRGSRASSRGTPRRGMSFGHACARPDHRRRHATESFRSTGRRRCRFRVPWRTSSISRSVIVIRNGTVIFMS